MHEIDGIQPIERAPLEHDDLAATVFLRRRSKDLDRAGNAKLRHRALRGNARKHGTRGDEVVPTRVTELRKCAVLRKEGDARTLTVVPRSPEGRGQIFARVLDGKALLREDLSAERARIGLLEANLRMRMDILGHGPHGVDVPVNGIANELPHFVLKHREPPLMP